VTPPLRVEIGLSVTDADPVYIDSQTRLLRLDMADQGFDPLRPPAPAPPGARGTGELLGTIQLLMIPTLGPKLLDLLQVWLANRRHSTIKLKVNNGTRGVELEFDPATTTWQDIDKLLASTTNDLIER
jgi:hypothetical protein